MPAGRWIPDAKETVVSSWYAIAGVVMLTYLILVAWVLVEMINAPLIDGLGTTRPTRRRRPLGRRRDRGLGASRGSASGRPT